MYYDLFAEDADVIYDQKQLLLKLYDYLFNKELCVISTINNSYCYCQNCGFNSNDEIIIELIKYVKENVK